MQSRSYHHGDLRNALLAEAAILVDTEGVAALTLREIARRLGVSHAAPTHHFPDKTALLIALGADGFEALATALEAPTEASTPAERFVEVGMRYVRFARKHPGHFRVMFGGSLTSTLRDFRRGAFEPSHIDVRLPENSGRAYRALENVVMSVLPSPNTEQAKNAAFLAWSVVHGSAVLVLEGPLPPHLAAPGDDGAVDRLVEHSIAAICASIMG